MSVTQKAHKEVDAKPTSAVQNQTKQRTNFGGILSIVAIAALVGLTVPYVKSTFFPTQKFDEIGNVERVLAETVKKSPSADFGPGYYSDINLRFQDQVQTDLFETLPTGYVNAAQNGIKKMSIAMVDEAEREVLATETALMAVGGFTNSSSLAKYTYSSRKSDMKDAIKDFMKYINFKQTNVYLRGTALDTAATADPESIYQFEEFITYLPDQFQEDKYGLFQELEIQDNINLMGDMYNQDTQLMKAYSTLEMQIDYYKLMYKAKSDLEDLITDLKVNNKIKKVKIDSWPSPDDTKVTYHEYKYDDMIESFHEDYTGPFDAVYREKLADYEDTIKELIAIEQGGNYFEPPPILGRESFYSGIKDKANTEYQLQFKDTSASSADPAFWLFNWIIYFQFDDPGTEVPAYLLSQFTSIVNSFWSQNPGYSGSLEKFIAKAGSTWNAGQFDDFFLESSPTNNGFYTCGGVTGTEYNGLTPGYALNEFTGVSLNQCASNCLAHNPTKCYTDGKLTIKPCPYVNQCTGFYYWNEQVNSFVGTTSALAEGYNKEIGHCIIIDGLQKNSQCEKADAGDTQAQHFAYFSFGLNNTSSPPTILDSALEPRLQSSDEFNLKSNDYSLDEYFGVVAALGQVQATVKATTTWNIKWWSLLQGVMRYKVHEIRDGLAGSESVYRKGIFDSAMLKIQYEYEEQEHVFGQSRLSWDCIEQATTISLNPSEAKVPCKHYGNLAVFQLNENYVQDIYTFYSKEYTVNEKRSLGNTLKLERIISQEYTMHVGPPRIGIQGYNFNTLWRMDFTMSPTKMVNNQMWFVQNPDEPRTTTQLYQDQQDAKSATTAVGQVGQVDLVNTEIKSIQWFELMAYVGGMWFIISKLMTMSNKLMNTNLKTLNFEIENLEQKKVSKSDLEHEGGEEEALTKKQKMAKLLDEILTPEQRVRLNSKISS